MNDCKGCKERDNRIKQLEGLLLRMSESRKMVETYVTAMRRGEMHLEGRGEVIDVDFSGPLGKYKKGSPW